MSYCYIWLANDMSVAGGEPRHTEKSASEKTGV